MASRLLGGYFVGGEMTVNRAACFVFNDYHRTSSVTNMISKLGWQDLETRGRISDLIIVFKIQTGHVKTFSQSSTRDSLPVRHASQHATPISISTLFV